jgi:hypothetical protein
LTPQRLRALTVIHNYGLKHGDGTTAAMRLFGTNTRICFPGYSDKWANFRLLEKAGIVQFVTLCDY